MNALRRTFPNLPALRSRRLYWAAVITGGLLGLAFAAYAAFGWSAPVTLANPIPPAYVLNSPVVAINSSGAQAAAWVSQDNDLMLQVAAQDAGGSWSAAQTLTPASGVNAADPSVAISPLGNAVAIWDVYASPNLLVQASARQPQGSWSAVATLTSPAYSSTVPKVGMDGSGNAVAIWLQRSPSGASAIETANLPASGSWTAPATISTPGVSATNPTLAVNSSGDAIAGWQTGNGQILVAERKAGVWGAPISIAPAAFRQGFANVALNDQGDAAVAWTGRGTALVATRAAGGTWTAPLTISKQSEGGSARIALDNYGNAVMIFSLVQYASGGYVYPVEAVSRPAGGSWGGPILVSAASDYASSPNLIATPAGTFVAGWIDDNTNTAHAAIRPIGQSAFGTPAALSTTRGPLVLDAASGHTAAIWIPPVQVSDAVTP